jgi:NADPH:quinone reductase-like Zn-dependent oxidoreductase
MRQLGIDIALEYADGAFEEWVQEVEGDLSGKGVDMVLDCIGGDTLRKFLGAVRRGGTVISVAEPIDGDWAESKARLNDHVKTKFFVVRPDGPMLGMIQEFVTEGALKDVVDRVWDLSQGRKAFEVLEKGHVRGKLVLGVRVWRRYE